MNNLFAQSCVISIFPSWLPCWVWNMLGIGIIVALFMDVVVYFIPRIFRFKRNDVIIKVDEYHNLGYMQSTRVGIQIDNDSDYKIFPSAKILGNIRLVEYLDDRSERSSTFNLDKGSRIIGLNPSPIKSEDSKELIFAEVDDNKNVLLLVSPRNSLKSFYSVKNGDYGVKTARWYFNFQLFGEIKNLKFKEGIYSSFIQASMMSGEVYLQMGDILKIK